MDGLAALSEPPEIVLMADSALGAVCSLNTSYKVSRITITDKILGPPADHATTLESMA